MFAKHFTRRTGLNITVESDDAGTAVDVPVDQAPVTDEVVTHEVNTTVDTDTTPAVQEEPLDVGDEEFDAAEAEVSELDVEVDNLNTAADQTDTLDAIADKLEVQEENGGATPETMEIVEVAVEHCIATLQGFKPRNRVTPALEAFGGTKRRQHATHVTVEGIREWAAEATKAIGAMVEKIIAFLKNIWAAITSGTSKMKQSLVSLREKLKAAGGKVADGTVKVSKSVVDKLKLGGQFTKETFFKGIENTKAFVTKVLNLLKITRKTTVDTVQKVDENSETAPEADVTQMAQAVKDFGGTSEELGEGVVTLTELEVLPGDVGAEVTGPSGEMVDGQAYRIISSVDVKLTSVSNEADVEDAEIKSFTAAEIEKAIAATEELVDLAEAAGAATKETIDVETKVTATTKSKFQRFKDSAGSAARNFKNFVGRVTGAIARPLGVVVRFLRNVIGSLIMVIGVLLTTVGAIASGNDDLVQVGTAMNAAGTAKGKEIQARKQ